MGHTGLVAEIPVIPRAISAHKCEVLIILRRYKSNVLYVCSSVPDTAIVAAKSHYLRLRSHLDNGILDMHVTASDTVDMLDL